MPGYGDVRGGALTRTITLIPGDGIGPEVAGAVLPKLKTAGGSIGWERFQAGILAFERTGHTPRIELIDSVRRNGSRQGAGHDAGGRRFLERPFSR